MIEYILNGRTIKVKPENEQNFIENNPDAVIATDSSSTSVKTTVGNPAPVVKNYRNYILDGQDIKVKIFNFFHRLLISAY